MKKLGAAPRIMQVPCGVGHERDALPQQGFLREPSTLGTSAADGVCRVSSSPVSHDDEEGRWCRWFESSVEPCGHVPPHEVCCGHPELHGDLEAGRPVVLSACELGRFVELTPPSTAQDRRWFEISVDDRIVEVPEPDCAR
jgi:hypothetical protein